MSIENLKSKCKNMKMYDRYVKFINQRMLRDISLNEVWHAHHILPKASDMFPEYKDFKKHEWNRIMLTVREHYLAHWMLAKMFPNTSQSRAFYYMCNKLKIKGSREYEFGRISHLTNMKKMYTPERNKKISMALSGKPKSKEHISKLVGHVVSQETREKLKAHNIGKSHSLESKKKMSEARTGKLRGILDSQSKENISSAKKKASLKWHNNGTISKLYNVAPEGWVVGRLPWVK